MSGLVTAAGGCILLKALWVNLYLSDFILFFISLHSFCVGSRKKSRTDGAFKTLYVKLEIILLHPSLDSKPQHNYFRQSFFFLLMKCKQCSPVTNKNVGVYRLPPLPALFHDLPLINGSAVKQVLDD